jgi:uncharacterized protein YggE
MASRIRQVGLPLLMGGLVLGAGWGLQPAIAQLLYPPVSEQRGISVTGQGRASVPADRAQVDILLTNEDPYADPYAVPAYEAPGPDGNAPEPPKPITAADLQDVVAALEATGLPASAITVNVPPVTSPTYSYPQLEVSLTLNITAPSREQINQLVQTVNTTLQTQTPQQAVFVRRVYVQYAIDSCAAIEQQAYAAAMADAQLRAAAIATAINVNLVTPPAVAELPFLGRFLSPCNEDADVVGALFWSPDNSFYNPEAPAAVEVFRELLVTYPIEN